MSSEGKSNQILQGWGSCRSSEVAGDAPHLSWCSWNTPCAGRISCVGFGLEHFRHVLWTRSNTNAWRNHWCLWGRWLLHDNKFFKDVHVPSVALREKSFLQRSESDTLLVFSSGKLLWSSWDQLIFCCGHALIEVWSSLLRATTGLLSTAISLFSPFL